MIVLLFSKRFKSLVTRRRGVKPSAFVQFTSSMDLDDYKKRVRTNLYVNIRPVLVKFYPCARSIRDIVHVISYFNLFILKAILIF